MTISKRQERYLLRWSEGKIEKGGFIGPANNKARPNQHIITLSLNDYSCIVPFVTDGDVWFLKTICQSRKYKGKI